MEFWNSNLTEKSWKIMQQLREKNFDFIVIGEWAAYLWTNLHKSKDIDIVVENYNSLNFLKKSYDLKKNNNLKKYEIKIEEIEIDIYVPFFLELTIPVEDLKKHSSKIKNFKVVKPEALLILKQGAEQDREKSVKGEKDRIDIITLVFYSGIDFKEYFKLIKKYKIEHFYKRLKKIIANFKDVKYVNMTPRELKLKKKEILDKLKTK